ncbi:MAG: phenylalanine--tRNA ligase subunit beta [Cellvibrionaceae bacterium]
MKVSEAWLREWVNPNVETEALAEQVTMAGLEVDAIEPVAGEFSGVIVGEIVSIEQHPDADKLRVCQVSGMAGTETIQVVCGAPNARAGIKIPFATVGAVLPDNFKIKKAKLRGVESFGMLCAQTELKAGEDDSGLWELPVDAPVGETLQNYLNLTDTVIDIDLTPNRGDCLSMRGVAREVGVLNGEPVIEPEIAPVKNSIQEKLLVNVIAEQECPRYLGRVIRGVNVSVASPLWLQEKLRRAGVRPHDCVVDVTNYVLLELGQPMHAFDLDKIDSEIFVRLAEKDEEIVLLDGQKISLSSDTLLIADKSGAIAVAGIMGGERTAVNGATKNVFLESAFFAPIALAGRARNYGLHTDASHRYERGVDYELPRLAMERASQLLIEIAGGEVGPIVECQSEKFLPKEKTVVLRKEKILNGLGFAIPDERVEDILTRLGLQMVKSSEASWELLVPSYRFDIEIEEDLLEELARIYGYNNLPTSTVTMPLEIGEHHESQLSLNTFKSALVNRDYHEAITYSFVSDELNKQFDPEGQSVKLTNPLSADLAVMRTSLWPGLINALLHNINRQQSRIRLFETGMRFVSSDELSDASPVEGLKQEPVIAGVIYGPKTDENWSPKSEAVDFYDLKGDVEALLSQSGELLTFSFEPSAHPALHPGQSAAILRDGKVIGQMGALHPQIAQSLDIAGPAYLFEVAQPDLLVGQVSHFNGISKYPEVRRDIAILVDKAVQSGSLLATVRSVAGDTLQNLKVFDVYVGKGIDTQRKSIALGLTFQHPSRTLTESEINDSVDAVIGKLGSEFNAELR